MTRPHVAVLAATGSIGGAERSLIALMSATADRIRFTVLLPEGGDLARQAALAGADVRVTPWSRRLLEFGELNRSNIWLRMATVMPGIRHAVRALRTSVAELRPDVVLTNGIKPHVVGALAAGRSPTWTLVWYLRESLEERRVSRVLLARLSRRCLGAIAISRYVATDATTYVDAHVPVRVIYNIIEPGEGKASAASLPRKGPEDIWFATIGALTPLKGHDLFLRAAVDVSKQLPGARFLIIGSAAYRTEQHLAYESHLRELATKLNLGAKVSFLGHRTDISALLRKIDILVQANRGPEGFGRSVAEAMLAGVPVVASNGWGLREIIEDGRTGWLVPIGDVAALSERMLVAGRDPSLCRVIGQQGVARAKAMFSATAAATAFTDFLAAVSAGKSA
jgi:glycosyltransferase involved in cell wall biosynthesis